MAADKGKQEQQQNTPSAIPMLDKGFVSTLISHPVTGKDVESLVPVSWPNTRPGHLSFFSQVKVLNPDVYGPDFTVYDLAASLFESDRESMIRVAASLDEQAAKILANYKQAHSQEIIADYLTEHKINPGKLYNALETAQAALEAAQAAVDKVRAPIAKSLGVGVSDVTLTKDSLYVSPESFERKTRTRYQYNWAHKQEYNREVNSDLYGHYIASLKWTGESPTKAGLANWTCRIKSDAYEQIIKHTPKDHDGSQTGKPYAVYIACLEELHKRAVESGADVDKDRKITASVAADFGIPKVGEA